MWNEMTAVNLVLSVTVLLLGIWGYAIKKNRMLLYIGVAFGLFAISHSVTLVGLDVILTWPLIVIRILAYLLVAYALYAAVK